MTKSLFAAIPILALALPALARMPSLENLRSQALGQLEINAPPGYERPAPQPPQPIDIATYATDEEFTFESDAKPALDERLAALRNAGVTVLGGRAFQKPNRRWTFAIDYVPTVAHGTQMPPAALLQTYRSPAAYWRESDAEEAMGSAAANLRNAGLPVLNSYLFDAGRDHSFAVDFLVPNALRPTQQYEVRFEKYAGGKFDFESEAEAAVAGFSSQFSQAGVPVLRGKAVRRPDRDYSVELEYVVRTNKYGPRPLYSSGRYDSRETFSFEDEAVKAAREKLPVFSQAGLAAVQGFSRKVNRDYSYSVDYLVRNIYQGGAVYPSAVVKTYQAAETFSFESEAETAMQEKTAAFNSAGLTVIGSEVIRTGRDYTYVLDYVAKAQQPGSPLPAPAAAGRPDSWDIERAAKTVVSLAEKADSLSLSERRRLEDKLEYLDSFSAAQLDDALMLGEQRALRSACRTIRRELKLPRDIRDLAESVESKL
ncbi:MAG: hypothetical protein HY748_08525 [Elusimicrobia bacterium]|nr:hypothetical protein [Elusimicrobiota bacterium]